MDWILNRDLGWLIVFFGLFPFIFAGFLYWVTQYASVAPNLQAYRGVVAPFFTSVSVVFALFAAFLGADIWQRVHESEKHLEKEVSAGESILQIASGLGSIADPIQDNVKQYMKSMLTRELTGKGRRKRSAAADQALQDLVQSILSLPESNERIRAAQQAMLVDYHELWKSRATRRHIATTHSDPQKWISVIFLGFLTQIALTLCHIEKPKPLAAALIVFTLAFAAILILLITHERPILEPTLKSLERMYHISGVSLE